MDTKVQEMLAAIGAEGASDVLKQMQYSTVLTVHVDSRIAQYVRQAARDKQQTVSKYCRDLIEAAINV